MNLYAMLIMAAVILLTLYAASLASVYDGGDPLNDLDVSDWDNGMVAYNAKVKE